MAAPDIVRYSVEVESIFLCKFGSLIKGTPALGDRKNIINLLPQVHEISIYESIFSPVMRAELALYDAIGLFVNFPLSGEEIIVINYRNVYDSGKITNKGFEKGNEIYDYQKERTLYFVIDTVDSLNAGIDARDQMYIIRCVALEAWANAKQTVQKGYKDKSVPDVAKEVHEEFINKRIRKFYPAYQSPNFIIENNDVATSTFIIPNLAPFAAMSLLSDMAISTNKDRFHTYLYYQNHSGFNFRSLQGLFDRPNERRKAFNNKYIYKSTEIVNDDGSTSPLYNEGRVVSSLSVNKRHSSLQKLSTGYFHNNHFEINIAQKAVWGEPTLVENTRTIYDHKLNTNAYTQLSYVEETTGGGPGDEYSNRTRYTLTTIPENDENYIISRMRDKWGRDLIATVAMAQVDVTAVIPGTTKFQCGDMFYLDISEMHGFNTVQEDDLISGFFLISEVKHIITIGGYMSTVLGLNKDSYKTSIDRESKY